MHYLKRPLIFSYTLLLIACGGGGGSSNETAPESIPLTINVSNFDSNVRSYEPKTITVSANYNCSFNLTGLDIHWVTTSDNKTFSYRAPITLLEEEQFNITVSSVPAANCPSGSRIFTHNVSREANTLRYVPDPEPYNYSDLKTDYFASHDLGFGGMRITDRFTATICYPTPEDCETWENELFGQDAHNMATGDFNGDGYEDMVVSWALFPHTIDLDQKVNAPVNIYLNDGNGNLYEDLSIYENGEVPSHPFAYRLAIADYNGDGIDDIFAGSMGLQYRDPDYANNFILPYPDLLLLSNSEGIFIESSTNIDDQNNGEGKLCGFSHDSSSGDFDNDGDIDIFACNILLVNDGSGNFSFHDYLERNHQFAYGNPMSSLVVDLNNDDFDDLVFWNFDNRQFWSDADEGYILLSNGSADIQSWKKVILPTGPFGENKNKYNHAASEDFNNDGFKDVVVAVTRDDPYYEGAYIQVLINDGTGKLFDETSSRFPNQFRADKHHGEGNIYVRDMNNDSYIDIIHSTRDYESGYHGAHIAINDGYGNFISAANADLPYRPDSGGNLYDMLMKGLPINADNSECLDLISVTDVGWGDNEEDTRNYLFTLINLKCI